MLIHLDADAAAQLEPGMTADVVLAAGADDGGWLVPSTVVQDRNGAQMVFVLVDGRPRPVQVTTGAAQGDQIVVQSAELAAGDRVLIDLSAMTGGFQRGGGQFPGAGTPPDGATVPGGQPQN
ncbi:MAG: hypothetical protein R2873_13000 [Caldilineaceae bacterium]